MFTEVNTVTTKLQQLMEMFFKVVQIFRRNFTHLLLRTARWKVEDIFILGQLYIYLFNYQVLFHIFYFCLILLGTCDISNTTKTKM